MMTSYGERPCSLRKSWRQPKEKRREDCESITTWDMCTCARKKESYYNMGYVYMCKKERERCRGRCDASTLRRSENTVNFESVETERLWSLRERREGGKVMRDDGDDMWGYYKRPS